MAWSTTCRRSAGARRCARRRCATRICRKSAGRIGTETERMLDGLGAEGRDGSPRLHDRAHDLHVERHAHRPGLPRRARPPSSRVPTTISRRAPTRWPTSIRAFPWDPFLRRDRARRRLAELIEDVIEARKRSAEQPRDMLQILLTLTDDRGQPRFTPDQITGMIVSTMFAGHHTSSALPRGRWSSCCVIRTIWSACWPSSTRSTRSSRTSRTRR